MNDMMTGVVVVVGGVLAVVGVFEELDLSLRIMERALPTFFCVRTLTDVHSSLTPPAP